jgi:hypothetical protein
MYQSETAFCTLKQYSITLGLPVTGQRQLFTATSFSTKKAPKGTSVPYYYALPIVIVTPVTPVTSPRNYATRRGFVGYRPVTASYRIVNLCKVTGYRNGKRPVTAERRRRWTNSRALKRH